MKVVMAQAPEVLLAKRKNTGADQWDEMWKGVLHMPPAPNRTHQDLEGGLEMWLRHFWVPVSHGKVYHQINVASITTGVFFQEEEATFQTKKMTEKERHTPYVKMTNSPHLKVTLPMFWEKKPLIL